MPDGKFISTISNENLALQGMNVILDKAIFLCIKGMSAGLDKATSSMHSRHEC